MEDRAEGTLLGRAGKDEMRLLGDGTLMVGGIQWDPSAPGGLDGTGWDPAAWSALGGRRGTAGLPEAVRHGLARSAREALAREGVFGFLVLSAMVATILFIGVSEALAGRYAVAAMMAVFCVFVLLTNGTSVLRKAWHRPSLSDAGGSRVTDAAMASGLSGDLWLLGTLAAFAAGLAAAIGESRSLGSDGWAVAASVGGGLAVLLLILLGMSRIWSGNRGSGRLTRLVGRVRPGGSVPGNGQG